MIKIFAPVIHGSGIEIYHERLAQALEDRGGQTKVFPLSSRREWFPPLLRWKFLRAVGERPEGDLIHASSEYSCCFEIPKIPLLVTLHHSSVDDEILPCFSLPVRLHHRWVLRHLLAKTITVAEKIVTVSHFTRETLRKVVGRELAMEVIYNGVDPEIYRPVESGGNTMGGRCVLFFAGNPSRRKGFDLLDPLMRTLGGDYQLRYTTGLRAAGKPLLSSGNALCLGWLSKDQLVVEINRADIILQPSRREGFGLSIVEGMACGKPVVSTNCSAIPEVLDHEKGGLLCEPGSVGQLASAIRRLAQSAQLRKQMGEYNRRQVLARFTLAQMADAYWKLYQQVRGAKA